MVENQTTLNQVRKIDNSRHWLPFFTSILLIFLIFLFVWFFRGGSFRLYTSIFFLIYSFTHQIWLSVILIGIFQNIIFLPLRIISSHFHQSLKDFEDELDKDETSEDQYFLVSDKNKIASSLKQGSLPIVFYIFNFFINAIAFFSAGRVFLIDFYTDPLKLQKLGYLYDFIPYPDYPLQGVNLNVPLFKFSQTTAISWNTIFLIIASFIIIPTAFRLLWRFIRFIFKKNQQILQARIRYNRLIFKISGFAGVGILILIYLLRHIPTSIETFIFTVDLSRQNTPMNFVTAIGTFIVTLHAGYKINSENVRQALIQKVPKNITDKVFRDKMRQSFKNAVILGLGAFIITNNIPSAFELSVTTFEVMYMIYPYTFGLILRQTGAIDKNIKDD